MHSAKYSYTSVIVESPSLQCSQGGSIYIYAVDLTTLFLKGILGMCLMVGRSQDDMTDSRQPLSFAEHFEFYLFLRGGGGLHYQLILQPSIQ